MSRVRELAEDAKQHALERLGDLEEGRRAVVRVRASAGAGMGWRMRVGDEVTKEIEEDEGIDLEAVVALESEDFGEVGGGVEVVDERVHARRG